MKSLQQLYRLGIFIAIILLQMSCSRSIYHVAYPTLRDGKYDTEFPYKNGSKELEAITRSVVRILSMTHYDDYLFAMTDSLIAGQMRPETLNKAYKKRLTVSTVSGSATIIAYAQRKALLLTCAHIFNKPDTIWTYFADEQTGLPFYVQSMSIQKNREINSPDLREPGLLRILYRDDQADVSLIIKDFDQEPVFPIPVLNYPFGHAAELEWGAFVYLVGFPKGRKMITKGIVSSPGPQRDPSFLVDALFNRGFSGGIILGIRDGVPNFEIVGIATSSYSDNEDILVPEANMTYDALLPYTGQSYVKRQENINYGLSIAVPSEDILKAIQKNRDALLNEGFDVSSLLAER